jgi:hypothetical protein
MTHQNIASLSLKLFGVYAIIKAVSYTQTLGILISSIVSNQMETNYPPLWLIGSLLPFLLLLIIGLALIFRSDGIGKHLVSDEETEFRSTSLSFADIQAIAFSIAGVILFAQAFPKLIEMAVNVNVLRRLEVGGMEKKIQLDLWTKSIGLVIELAIGLGLFFGARGLANLWHKLQETRPINRGSREQRN